MKNDLSDLLDKLKWAKQDDDECKIIADQARKLAVKWFNQDYLDLYIYRLIEAYAAKQELYYDH